MKRIVVCVLLTMLMVFQGSLLKAQQEIYVSLLDGWDDWNSGVLMQPFKTVEKAIAKAVAVGAKEVRVVVGEYHLSSELKIPVNLSLIGGYKSKETVRVQNSAEQTILIGSGSKRVAVVEGLLEGVTVKGGFCKGGNGGGVFVKSTGRVVNCIVVENKATFLLPKVGDLLMKDGTYLDVNNFTYDQRANVEGVIFWVNPDKGADIGKQGYAVGTGAAYNVRWANSLNKSGTFCKTISDAVSDMDGRGNTDDLKSRYTDCNAVNKCREKGAQWSLPALGQLMQLAAEWSVLEISFGKLWDEMLKIPGNRLVEMQAFFGSGVEINERGWSGSQHFLVSSGMLFSSTLQDKSNVWKLEEIIETTIVGKASLKDFGNVLFVVEF